ncbi:MAG: hypothetical protein JSR17_01755 [Proteobacteria bacterium]|nr:hypothetical protein [Pseudomonadota bacterium]
MIENNLDLQNKFCVPSIHNGIPSLTLKIGHGYQNGAQAFEELRAFAKPTLRKKTKKEELKREEPKKEESKKEEPLPKKLILKFKLDAKTAQALNLQPITAPPTAGAVAPEKPLPVKPENKAPTPIQIDPDIFGDVNFTDINPFSFGPEMKIPSFGSLLVLEDALRNSNELIFSSPKLLSASDTLPTAEDAQIVEHVNAKSGAKPI